MPTHYDKEEYELINVRDIERMNEQLGTQYTSQVIANAKPTPPKEEKPWWHGVALETGVGLAADWLLPGLDPISRGLNYGIGYGTNVVAQRLRGETEISQGEAHAAGGFQAIPFGTTAKGFKGLRRAMYKGAGTGLVGRQVEVGIDEGRALTPGEAISSAGVGAAFGGTFKGAAEGGRELKDSLIRQILKDDYSKFRPLTNRLGLTETGTVGAQKTPIIPFKDDDISQIRYKQDLEYNKAVNLELKRWGMDDGIFDIDTFFKQVRKQDHQDAIKSTKEGRDFIELFLTPQGKKADFYAMERSKSGDHQIFKARFIDFLEARGISTSDVLPSYSWII